MRNRYDPIPLDQLISNVQPGWKENFFLRETSGIQITPSLQIEKAKSNISRCSKGQAKKCS
jgi:hypothetical protein